MYFDNLRLHPCRVNFKELLSEGLHAVKMQRRGVFYGQEEIESEDNTIWSDRAQTEVCKNL